MGDRRVASDRGRTRLRMAGATASTLAVSLGVLYAVTQPSAELGDRPQRSAHRTKDDIEALDGTLGGDRAGSPHSAASLLDEARELLD